MKTLFIFASNHGTTADVAHYMAAKSGVTEPDVVEVGKATKIDWNAYACIIIGASIHAGQIQRSMRQFLKKNEELLLSKKLGLFLCAMHKDAFKVQLKTTFPPTLRNHALACEVVGGAFKFEKMSHFERVAIAEITGIEESVNKIDYSKIEVFLNKMFGK